MGIGSKKVKVLFFVYPFFKSKGGAEKIILCLANHFYGKYSIFVLSEDSKRDLDGLILDKRVRHLYVPFESKNILKIFISLFVLALYLIKYKPIIVHSHHRRMTLIFSVFKLFPFVKFKLIHTSHNVFNYGQLFRYARCDLLTGVSKSVVGNLIYFFRFKKERVKLIYNGIAEYKGDFLPNESNSAVVVGRLSIQKGHIYLLKAWKKVIKQIPEAILYIVGNGELREELENFVLSFNLYQNVVFVGFCPNPTEWMLKTEFGILPSLWEGLPLFPIEAFSVKRTVVATAVDGTPEVVIDKETGLLVPPKDVEILAEAIIFMFKNPECRKEMAENGYGLFKEKFTINKMLKRYEQVYQKVIGS